jgi:diguanylate cyclase (GGDEF)-like protein
MLVVLGNLLEVISTDAGEAFTGIKILYLGNYLSVFIFLFVADYFDIKLSRYFVKLPLLIIPALIALALITTNYHHLVYEAYWLSPTLPHTLEFSPGLLYLPINIYLLLCAVPACVIIAVQLRAAKKDRRQPLIFLLIGVITPFVATIAYTIAQATGLNTLNIYYTPYFLAAMSIFFYIGIIRYGMLDIVGKATNLTMESITEAYVLVDDNMRRLDANAAACQLFSDLETLPDNALITSVAGWPAELSNFDVHEDNFSVQFSIAGEQVRHYTAKGNKIAAQKDVAAGWLFLIQDVTENHNLIKKLEEAANTDALTTLYNRRYFIDLAVINFERAKRQDQICYAMILDLDFFKEVHDRYGHLAGDEALRVMSARARDAMRPYDMIARYGGEEFVVLLTDCNRVTAEIVAERLRKAVANDVCIYDNQQIPITVSIGLAESKPADSLDDLLARADQALYEAKSNGRNQVRYVYE